MDRMESFKVRAKNAATAEWVYGYLVPYPDGISGWAVTGDHYLNFDRHEIYTFHYTEVLNDTIGRFAGVTDYFNNPAFEGDIIIEDDKYVGIIRFGEHAPHVSHLDKTACGFYVEWLGERSGILRTDVGYWLNRRNHVIRGNIYDTPDLIKGGHNE